MSEAIDHKAEVVKAQERVRDFGMDKRVDDCDAKPREPLAYGLLRFAGLGALIDTAPGS